MMEGSYRYVGVGGPGKYEFDVSSNRLKYVTKRGVKVESRFIYEYINLPPNYEAFIRAHENIHPEISSAITLVNSAIDLEIERPSNDQAFFILPSQLNGAEYPDANYVVKELAEYTLDETGGPRGQLAVHPAVGQLILDLAAHQDKLEGTDGFSALEEKIPSLYSHNGYLVVPAEDQTADQVLANLGELLIVGMKNVAVDGYYYDRGPQKRKGSNTRNHFVNLIYASAVPIDTYTNPYVNCNLLEIANYLMIGEYYGGLEQAYILAEESKVRTLVYLMPLGAGVFNNFMSSIVRNLLVAIALIEQKYPKVPQFLDLCILAYAGSKEGKLIEAILWGEPEPEPSQKID